MIKMLRIIFGVLVYFMSCSIFAQPIVHVEYPSYNGRSNQFKCLSVRLTNDKTIITQEFVPVQSFGWFWVNKGCYLQTYDSPQKYKLLYVKNAADSEANAKKTYNSTTFTQVFEPLPANCTRFKYYEPDGRYEIYDLNSYTGRKFIYSSNTNSYYFNRITTSFSTLINNYSDKIGISTESNTFKSKLKKIEVSFNNPTLTITARYAEGTFVSGYEFRFNINDVQIEEYSFDSGTTFYVINNCLGSYESKISYYHLDTYYNCEDFISSQANYCKSLIFSCDSPLLNKKLGYALLALIKSAKNPNESVSADFNKAPSGISFIKKRHGRSSATADSRIKNKKNVTTRNTINRIPTLKKQSK